MRKINANITINLTKDNLKDIIIDYLEREGYEVKKENINFECEMDSIGYGMNEHSVPIFRGCDISEIKLK